jgi:trehalose 6-phosphate synthase
MKLCTDSNLFRLVLANPSAALRLEADQIHTVPDLYRLSRRHSQLPPDGTVRPAVNLACYMRETAGNRRVLVAANRGPLSFTRGDGGQLIAKRGGGGMVSGLSAVANSDAMLWVCAALSDGDRAAARAAPDGLLEWDGTAGKSAVQMLDLPPTVFHRAYNAVANSTLWFVHHMLFDTPNRPTFGPGFRREWESFRSYNHAFAKALAGAAGPTDPARVVIQDYHLCLAPKMLVTMAPRARIAHFSHTPWAPPDYYRMLPADIGREVLTGILGADHAGFLCRRWADAFMACCAAFLDCQVDANRGEVRYEGHVTSIGVHPLGVDANQLRERAAEQDVQGRLAALAEQAGGRKLIVRVDRTELSKNIVRGLLAYRELLISRPGWRGKVTHVAFAYPSRHDLPEYREYTAAVQRLARQIEDELAMPGGEPLILQVNDDYARSLAALRLADVLLVNPIRDGMNLVAKEGPILSDHACALVLSTEAGAAAELGDAAILVNPFDVTQTAEALHEALIMAEPERARRCAALASASGSAPPARWFADQLDALDELER